MFGSANIPILIGENMTLTYDPIALLEVISLVFVLVCMIKLLVAEISDLGDCSTNTLRYVRRGQGLRGSDSTFNVGKTIPGWQRVAHS